MEGGEVEELKKTSKEGTLEQRLSKEEAKLEKQKSVESGEKKAETGEQKVDSGSKTTIAKVASQAVPRVESLGVKKPRKSRKPDVPLPGAADVAYTAQAPAAVTAEPSCEEKKSTSRKLLSSRTSSEEDPLAIPANPWVHEPPKVFKCGKFTPKLRHHRPMYKPEMPPTINPQVQNTHVNIHIHVYKIELVLF